MTARDDRNTEPEKSRDRRIHTLAYEKPYRAVVKMGLPAASP